AEQIEQTSEEPLLEDACALSLVEEHRRLLEREQVAVLEALLDRTDARLPAGEGTMENEHRRERQRADRDRRSGGAAREKGDHRDREPRHPDRRAGADAERARAGPEDGPH